MYGRLDGPTKFGTLAEYTIAPRAACMPITPGVGVIDATYATSVGLTGCQSIIPKVKDGAGKRVFINGGSGGCGTFAILIAKAAGCYVTTSCSSTNVELSKSLRADTVIDYSSKDVVTELKKMQPFDLMVDKVGLPKEFYWSVPSFTNPDAPYVQVGALAVTLDFILGNLYRMIWPGWLYGARDRGSSEM